MKLVLMVKYVITMIALMVIVVGSGEFDVQRGKRRTVKAIYAVINKTGVKRGDRYIATVTVISKLIGVK